MTGQEYPVRRRTESAAFGWKRRRSGAGEDSPGAQVETPPARPAGPNGVKGAPPGRLNVGGTTKCEAFTLSSRWQWGGSVFFRPAATSPFSFGICHAGAGFASGG